MVKITVARHLYVVKAITYGKLKTKKCSRCGEGFDIGHTVFTRSKKAHSKYGAYHKKCAQEVNLL